MVDDYPDGLALLTALLESKGAEVAGATTADEGLALVRALLPDILISDVGMPLKDGCQLVREVRLLPSAEGGATPAIAVTGFGTPQDRERTRLAGFQVHLTKPLDLDQVVAAVRRVLRDAPGDVQ